MMLGVEREVVPLERLSHSQEMSSPKATATSRPPPPRSPSRSGWRRRVRPRRPQPSRAQRTGVPTSSRSRPPSPIKHRRACIRHLRGAVCHIQRTSGPMGPPDRRRAIVSPPCQSSDRPEPSPVGQETGSSLANRPAPAPNDRPWPGLDDAGSVRRVLEIAMLDTLGLDELPRCLRRHRAHELEVVAIGVSERRDGHGRTLGLERIRFGDDDATRRLETLEVRPDVRRLDVPDGPGPR